MLFLNCLRHDHLLGGCVNHVHLVYDVPVPSGFTCVHIHAYLRRGGMWSTIAMTMTAMMILVIEKL